METFFKKITGRQNVRLKRERQGRGLKETEETVSKELTDVSVLMPWTPVRA